MDEDSPRRKIREAIDVVHRPAPGLLTSAVARVHSESAGRRPRLRALMLETVGALLLVVAVFGLAVALQQARRDSAVKPSPSLEPSAAAPRLDPAAQVAWLSSGIGIDAAGKFVGPVAGTDLFRSPDGTRIYALVGNALTAYSALTGEKEGTAIELGSPSISRQMSISSDGRYVGVLELGSTYAVGVTDLQAGRLAARVDTGVAPPSIRGPGLLILSPNSRELYLFTNLWQQPADVLVFSFDESALRLKSRVTDGKDGHAIPVCNGLFPPVWAPGGLPIRLLPDARTIVIYCPSDGRVSWFDLGQLTVSAALHVDLPNPFWLAPVFSSDGKMLYLHEGFSGHGGLQVVDLAKRQIIKSTGKLAGSDRAFRWLAERFVTTAYAGGTMRTAAISPDGSWVYLIGQGGVHVLRVPDLSEKAVWLPSTTVWRSGDGPTAAVWLSGDGRTLYVLGRDQRIYILRTSDGKVLASTPVGRQFSGDFLVFAP